MSPCSFHHVQRPSCFPSLVYTFTSEEDLKDAATRLETYMQEKKVTLLVTPQQVGGSGEGMLHTERLEIPEEYMELARGIEPPTSGLQNRCSAD